MLTVQTLCETYWAVHRKRPQELEVARRFLTLATERIAVVAADASDFLEASTIHASRPVHFWDTLLASTLRRHTCQVLLTEDAQDRPSEGGLRYLNPFQASSEELATYTQC